MSAAESALTDALQDRYILERELGRGGMATVYLARDRKHDRHVALKLLHGELAAALGPDRFLREIKLTARLDHPHILPVLDSGETLGRLWYTMPFVEGESLRDRLRREPQLPVDEALAIVREVGDALDYAHRQGVIHRDIKPENILLAEGHARVADFGVARAVEAAGEELTGTGLAVGTPTYMSPEQAGAGQVDPRTDVYALGCVLHEMLAGEPPFTGPTPQAVVAKRFIQPPPPLSRLRPTVPAAVDVAVRKALAVAPADRFATVAEFTGALVGSSPSRAAHRPRRALWLGLGLAAALGIAAAALLWPRKAASPDLDADLLAVAPFDVLSPSLELWREGLVDLLSRNLDGAGPLRTVPPTAVVRRWTGHADPMSAAELGRRTGARLAVFGSLVPAGGDSARLRATLLDVETERPLAEFELRDAVERVDRLGDSLAVRVLGELGRERRLELTGIASLGSTSPVALKAFLQGEQWFRRGGWDSALSSYERAVGLDSGFALAVWRLGRVVGWQRAYGESLSTALALRAGTLNRGLAPRDSLVVTADSLLHADVSGMWAGYQRLVSTAREATRRYPHDGDAWHTLGEAYAHTGREPPEVALAAFERAIDLDSAYAPAYIHAIELASYVHDFDTARRYAQHYLRRAPGDVTAQGIRLALTLADPALAGTPEVRRALERAPADVLLTAWLPFHLARDSGEVALQVARALARSPESPNPWMPPAFRRAALAYTLAYRGHVREAAETWTRDMMGGSVLLADLAVIGAFPHDSARPEFEGWLQAGNLYSSLHGLPLWSSRGDTASLVEVRRLADSLERSGADAAVREEAAYGAHAARAYLALAGHDTARALQELESLPDSLCWNCYFQPLTRLLLQSARREDRKVLAGVEPYAFFPMATDVTSKLEKARAAERLGERDEAIRRYRFVADAWRHADADLQPYVKEARGALQRLSSEP